MKKIGTVYLATALLLPYSAQALSLRALCESIDGNSYLGIFEKASGVFSISTSGALDLGKTEIHEEHGKFVLLSERNWEPIIIPRGKNEVTVAGGIFNCDN